jgi:NADH:ubiquinone oxidoreductase subunit 3 (subunit A)
MILGFFNGISLKLEYLYIFNSLSLSVLISVLLYSVVLLITYKQYDIEKVSAYECGFHPFEDTREKFNVRFYLVSILFIIFDLEITFLFPWAVNLRNMDMFSFWSMCLFLLILTIGFIYEWLKGALDWE